MTITDTATQSPQSGNKLPSARDGLAIAALVCAFFVPILGIIFGHVSNHNAKKAGREKSGLAIAGLILGYIFTGLTALITVIAVAMGASGASGTATASPARPASSAPAQPSKPSAPPAKRHTLLRASGSGNYTTAKFTVGGTGDYDVHWTYQPTADFASQGMSANFSVQADNGNDMQFNDPNQLGQGGSGVVHVYSDAGTHYLTITGEADWTIIVTAMSGQPAAPQATTARPAQSTQPGQATQVASAKAVVDQFYQDLNARDYQAAWQLGGSNVSGGAGYSAWVAGYATTASISASIVQDSDGTVSVTITATQTNGGVKTYAGTYTAASGVIVAAHITQTGGPA